jgi:putative ABC transport system permease protein
MVLAGALRLGAAGILIGLVAAYALAHVMGSLLFGITPTDLVAYTVAVGTLAAAVALASLVPARRAASASPMDVLRNGV